jgi:prepilin-type N-terminal cleavage/methylation domain-containing protein
MVMGLSDGMIKPSSSENRNGFLSRGFTLVELLIVIAILAVLAAAVVIVLNPAELLAQARDSQRITDLKTLKDAIDIFVVDNPSASLGTAERVYISLPDTSLTCANISLPTLPAGWTYNCVTSANLRNTDGTGWVPLNLGTIFGGTPIPYLPLDPSNDLATGRYYTYTMGGSYQLSALMEAEKSFAMKDGGRYVEMFEVGSDLSLLPVSRDPSLVGYWTFEGTGSISNGQTTGLTDSSGRGNNGTAMNADGTGLSFISGKSGNAAQFSGINDYVNVPHSSSLDIRDELTAGAWVKMNDSIGAYRNIILKGTSGQQWIWLYINASDRVSTRIRTNNTNYSASATTSLPIDTWMHFMYTYDGSKIKIYKDGEMIGTPVSVSGRIDSTTDGFKFSYPQEWWGETLAWNFNGIIDEVRVFNRALSATEIKLLYEATK